MDITVTGHRPHKLGGYNHPNLKKVTLIFIDWLQVEKPEHAYIGMAIGTDQCSAEACIEVGVPFTAVIPFKGQENHWPKSAREHYNWLLSQASQKVIVCEGTYSPWKMQVRNEWMVDRLDPKKDKLVSLWDGSEGGTYNCIKYARTKGIDIVNLYNQFKS